MVAAFSLLVHKTGEGLLLLIFEDSMLYLAQ